MRIVLCILVTACSLFSVSGMDKKEALEILADANSKLEAKEYADAVKLYKSVQNDFRSLQLFHNLGLAYFYEGNLAQAILSMERAHKLNPRNNSVERNLKLLNENVESDVIKMPDFFLKSWYNGVSNLARSTTWLFFHLVVLLLAIFFLYKYLIEKRDFGYHFYYIRGVIIGLFILSLVFASFSFNRYSRMSDDSFAIVLADGTPLRLGAEDNSEEVTKVNEGVKVRINDEINEFYKIKLEDYTEAWVLKSSIERI